MVDQPSDPGRADRKKKRDGRKSTKTPEFVERLDQIAKIYPAARLTVDLARDAGLEILDKQKRQNRRLAHDLARMRKKRDRLHDRLVELLHQLTTAPVVLPRPLGRSGVNHDQLLATFRQFRAHDFPALSRLLHARIGRADVTAYQRLLVDEILVKGGWILVEHLMRHAGKPSTAAQNAEFAEQLRDHIAGSVCQWLARKAGYQMTPDVGEHHDALIAAVVAFLGDLLTATPAARLLIPLVGSPFDPLRHEAIAGGPEVGDLKVTATLFPGFAVHGDSERVQEKAQVYTEFVEDGA